MNYLTDISSVRVRTRATFTRQTVVMCAFLVLQAFVSQLFDSQRAFAQIRFEDVTATAIDAITSESWGLSAGDYNGDGWPDLYVDNHRNRPALMRNDGKGTLSDVMLQADEDRHFIVNRQIDHHMGVFSDVDNDGDDDLFVRELLNNSWERTPNWSSNGLLRASGNRLSDNDAWAAEEDCNAGHPDWVWPQFGDLDDDGNLDYLCVFLGRFEFISPAFYTHQDIAIEDFDGDLRQEVFGLLGGSFIDDAKQITPTRAEAFLQYTHDEGRARMQFRADPPVTFTINHKSAVETVTLFGGSERVNTVDITYNNGVWDVVGQPITSNIIWQRYKTAYIQAEAVNGLSDVQVLDPLASSAPVKPRMMDYFNGGWRNRTWDFGFREELLCDGMVAGDFDNDKDQDLYLTCREGVENIPNILYENDGTGHFSKVANAGDAVGPLGAGLAAQKGTADNVVTLDYDNDGFLDLAIANGRAVQPIRVGGPISLMHNLGNDNHWIHLDLNGSAPNFDALGARVYATSGGTTQMRFQNGGFHRFSQNHQRLHFGLGQDTNVDIEIRWSDGSTQTHTNLAVDNIYTVEQGGDIQVRASQPAHEFSAPQLDDDCGAPTYLRDLDQELFLYRTNCSSNKWQVRVTGGSYGAQFVGQIKAGANTTISNVTANSIESSDVLSATSNNVDFTLNVGRNGEDGFAFEIAGDDACLTLFAPNKAQILLGDHHVQAGVGINPVTLESCVAQAPLSLAVSDVIVGEGDQLAQVAVTLNRVANAPVSVKLATQAGTAVNGDDFWGLFRQLNFAPGETEKIVAITVIDDGVIEVDESFVARLFDAQGAGIVQGQAVVTIADDDAGVPQVTIAPADVNEGAGAATIEVRLSAPQSSVVSVALSTVTASTINAPVSGWATGSEDFYGLYRVIEYQPGEVTKTIDVTILEDTDVEPNERIDLRLFRSAGVTIPVARTPLVIIDND